MFGYLPSEVLGNNINMLMPEPYHSKHDAYLDKHAKTGETKIIGIGREVEGLRKCGSTFPADLAVSKLMIGETKHFVGIIRDITDQKQARIQYETIAKDLTLLIDSANAPIFGIDSSGRVNEWNQTAERITGFSKDDVMGKHLIKKFITEDFKASVKSVLDSALIGEETANYEFPLYTKDGERVDILLNSTTRRGEDGNIVGVIGVGQDITERKKADFKLRLEMAKRKTSEQKLKEANEGLSQSMEKMRLDLETAAKIQHSLLPNKQIRIPGINASWEFKPCDALGGDLLNIFPLDDKHCGFYLFDVSGHGVQASLLAVSIHRLLSNQNMESFLYDRDGQIRSTSEVIARLNQEFQMDLATMKYFTIFYGIISYGNGVLHYCQAGHPPPIICSSQGGMKALQEGDLPVGMFPDTEFQEHKIQLLSGDRILLYSDGVTEAEHQGEPFGEERLTKLFLQNTGKTLESCNSAILNILEEWQSYSDVQDDRTLLAIEIK
jgi:PAS domain S-box-containing protein